MIDIVVISLLQAVAGQPQPVAPEPLATQEESKASPETPPEDQVRCRRVQTVGTRLAVRRCSTPRQDEEARRAASEMIGDVQNAARTFNPESGFFGPDPGP